MERQTTFARPGQTPTRWHLVDAEGQVLGRMATRIATILMGKHTPHYTPHVDTGDFVVVINAGKVKLTGRKLDQKFDKRFSGYPSGLKQTPYRVVRQRHPERLIHKAVRRMLPKTPMGRKMLGKLKVYAGPEHPHQAQQPVALKLD